MTAPNRRSPRNARSSVETTRSRILEIAAAQLAIDGYHGTSYGALVEASGLSKGAFYHHFPSKLQLALAVYEAKQAFVKEACEAAIAAIPSPLERIFEVLRVRARLFATDRTLQCLPRIITDLARTPELAGEVVDSHRLPTEWLGSLLEEAKNAGEVHPDVPPRVVARVLFSTMVGINELSERESRSADHVARTEELITVLEALLVPQAPALGARASAGRSRRGVNPKRGTR